MTSTAKDSLVGDSTVDWRLAEQVAVRIGSRAAFAGNHHLAGLVDDFDRHTQRAEDLVAKATGLRSLTGDARARVVDRSAWIRANLVSLQRLLRPLFERGADDRAFGGFSLLGPRVWAVEMGVVLGWMSTRVLGQYDLLVLEDEEVEDQDIVYYVGPNVVAFEQRYAFEPNDFRLWLALHELTHRAQFTGVAWMRDHYLSLVRALLDEVETEPVRFLDGLRSALARRRGEDGPSQPAGVLSLVASSAQQRVLDQIVGLMSLLEGHGDTTMDRAGNGIVVEAGRFGRVMRDRRRSTSGTTRIFQRLVGLDVKLAQYAQGEAFIAAVESAAGPELLARVWEAPRNLPDLTEIRDPKLWLSRIAPTTQVDL